MLKCWCNNIVDNIVCRESNSSQFCEKSKRFGNCIFDKRRYNSANVRVSHGTGSKRIWLVLPIFMLHRIEKSEAARRGGKVFNCLTK